MILYIPFAQYASCIRHCFEVFSLMVHTKVPYAHYSDVIMSGMASQITGVSIVFQLFVKAHIKENIKAPRHWPLWGKCFHLMTSSGTIHLLSGTERSSWVNPSKIRTKLCLKGVNGDCAIKYGATNAAGISIFYVILHVNSLSPERSRYHFKYAILFDLLIGIFRYS